MVIFFFNFCKFPESNPIDQTKETMKGERVKLQYCITDVFPFYYLNEVMIIKESEAIWYSYHQDWQEKQDWVNYCNVVRIINTTLSNLKLWSCPNSSTFIQPNPKRKWCSLMSQIENTAQSGHWMSESIQKEGILGNRLSTNAILMACTPIFHHPNVAPSETS